MSAALARTIPVNPPIRKTRRKSVEARIGKLSVSEPLASVKSQLNNLMAVGTAMMRVAVKKKARVSKSKCMVNI